MGYSSYTAWAQDGLGEQGGQGGPSKGWGSYDNHGGNDHDHGWGDDDDEKKGLTDEEILKSKRKSNVAFIVQIITV